MKKGLQNLIRKLKEIQKILQLQIQKCHYLQKGIKFNYKIKRVKMIQIKKNLKPL